MVDIGAKDPIIWAKENNKLIDGQDPITWVRENYKDMDMLIWAVENQVSLENNKPLENTIIEIIKTHQGSVEESVEFLQILLHSKSRNETETQQYLSYLLDRPSLEATDTKIKDHLKIPFSDSRSLANILKSKDERTIVQITKQCNAICKPKLAQKSQSPTV